MRDVQNSVSHFLQVMIKSSWKSSMYLNDTIALGSVSGWLEVPGLSEYKILTYEVGFNPIGQLAVCKYMFHRSIVRVTSLAIKPPNMASWTEKFYCLCENDFLF